MLHKKYGGDMKCGTNNGAVQSNYITSNREQAQSYLKPR